jgi:hypothetical protein
VPPSALTILNKGLNFIPTNPNTKAQLQINQKEIKESKLPETEKQRILDLLPSLFESTSLCSNSNSNLTNSERHDLGKLKRNPNIVLKPTDKNMGIAVIDKSFYTSLVNHHLDCPSYEKLETNPLQATIEGINKTLETLTNNKAIPHELQTKLSPPDEPRIGLFYGLPKLHKPKLAIRPIISNCNHPTSNLSQWLHEMMAPTAIKAKSHILNSYHLVNEVKALQCNKNTFIVTADIESLYTNIPNKEGAKIATQECYNSNPPPIDKDAFHQLLLQVLENNVFEFNDNHYIQRIGTAMGTIMAPSYANVILKHLEETRLLDNPINGHLTKQILYYKRYIDDITVIFNNNDNNLPELIKLMKSTYAPLKLNIQYGKTQPFLDVKLKLNGATHKIETELYSKPMDNSEPIEPTTNHAAHTILNTISQEFARIYRLCSNPIDKFKHITMLTRDLRAKKHTQKQIDRAHTIALKYDHHSSNKKAEQPDKQRVMVTHNKASSQIKFQDEVKTSYSICFRNLPSLKRMLIRARLNAKPKNPKRSNTNNQTLITNYFKPTDPKLKPSLRNPNGYKPSQRNPNGYKPSQRNPKGYKSNKRNPNSYKSRFNKTNPSLLT